MNNITGPITKEHEIWHCNDSRFPKTKDLAGPPPTEKMLNSLQEFQQQPVGVIKTGYVFVWGRRRLKGIRKLFEAGLHNGDVDVVIITGVDPNDAGRLAIIENEDRSPNEITAWETVREMLFMKPVNGVSPTYESIARHLGLTVGAVKSLERRWSKVPVWATNAVARGEISTTVAIGVGRLSKMDQEECKATLKKDKKLTAFVIKEKKQVRQSEVYAGMMGGLGLNITQPRQYFSRDELIHLRAYISESTVEATLSYIEELLSQSE